MDIAENHLMFFEKCDSNHQFQLHQSDVVIDVDPKFPREEILENSMYHRKSHESDKVTRIAIKL